MPGTRRFALLQNLLHHWAPGHVEALLAGEVAVPRIVTHEVRQLDPDIAYLSGDRLPDGVRGFEVLDELGFSEKRLRQALSAHDAGAVEILVRGVDVDPDALRRRLKLHGSSAVSVVIARIDSGTASRATAFICRPSR